MATIKLHLYSDEDPGTTSCDYRGQGELKGHHKTLLEHEFGTAVETNAEIEAVIKEGPVVNRLLEGMVGSIPGFKLRLGVFDH